MSYPDKNHMDQPMARVHQYSDLGQPDFRDLQLSLADRELKYFLRDAGIPVGEDGKIPDTGGVPRIFVMGIDAEGREKPMRLEEAGLDLSPKNPKFWQQVCMGNVFAYPAGEEHPVQLQADPEEYNGGFKYTRPIPPDQMPLRDIPEPSGFARIMNRISGGRWFKNVTLYDNLQRDKEQLKETLSKMDQDRAAGREGERKAAEDLAAAAARNEYRKTLQANAESRRNDANAVAEGYKVLHSIYKPVPQKYDDHIKNPDGSNKGLYTHEQFAELKVFSKDELDLSKIVIAPKGQIGSSASERDFCSIAMFAGMQFQIAEKVQKAKKLGCKDPHAVESLQKNLGLTNEQARQVIADGIAVPYSTDMFKMRDSLGNFFSTGVNGGRQEAADAFNQYKQGNKEPLAKIIAFGIGATCRHAMDIQALYGLENRGEYHMSAQLLSLMKRDPELEKLAYKNGMTEKQHKLVDCLTDYMKLDDARNKAKLKIAEAAASGSELDPKEKESCMKAIVKASLVESMWLEGVRNDTNDKVEEMKAKLSNTVQIKDAQQSAWEKDPAKRPKLEDGKFWSDTVLLLKENVFKLYRPAPGVILSLKDQSSLDEITSRIVAQDNAADKSCDALSKMYEPDSSDISKLASRSVQIAEDIKNEKLLGLAQGQDKGLDKDHSINNEEIANKEGQGPQL